MVRMFAFLCVVLALVPMVWRGYGEGPYQNPSEVEFARRTYNVVYDNDHVWLVEPGAPLPARDLGRGTDLLWWDFDGDGRRDLGVLVDERDGFRRTFAYLSI